jgi:large subunit ribosomal protein L4
MVHLALRSALSDRAAEGKVAVVDAWDFAAPKTREANEALEALGLTGKVLVVLDYDDVTAAKSFRNLPRVHPLLASELNAYDILCSDWIVFTRATLPGVAQETTEAPAPAPEPATAEPATAETEIEPEPPAAASEVAPPEEQA